MDLNAIKNRLSQLQTTNTRTSNLWKPSPGTEVVRIVPYKHNKDNPFIELYFHYDLGGKNYLSPVSFGRPDPIEEFAQKLKSTSSKDDYRLGRKVEAKMRTFAPVVVRGEEKEGVRFWGFGKTVYQELLSLIADPDYGDISDASNGRDIVVERQTAAEAGNQYGKTTIRVKPNQTSLADEGDVLEKLLNEQANLTELYTEPSYDELKEHLSKFLNPSDGDSKESEPEMVTTNASSKVEDDFDKLFNS